MAKSSAKPLEGFEDLLFTTKFGTPICDQIMIDSIKKIVDEINICRDELEKFGYFSPHCDIHLLHGALSQIYRLRWYKSFWDMLLYK